MFSEDAKDRDGDTDSQKSLKEEDGNLITSYPDTRMQVCSNHDVTTFSCFFYQNSNIV